MKILITGLSGFFGQNFFQFLNREYPEHDLYGLDLVFGQDCRDYDIVDKAVRDKDLVISLASLTHTETSLHYPELFLNDNIKIAYNILKACTFHKVKLIFVSSSEVYGSLEPGWEKQSEDHPFKPCSPYALTKAYQDLMCQTWHRVYGTDVVIVRPFNTYGFFQDARKVISKFIDRILKNKPITIYGDGTQTRDWTFITDIIKGIWMAKDLPAGEIINLCSGKDYSILEIIELLKKITGKDIQIQYDKPRLGEVKRMIGDNTKAKNLLGWQPTISFEEGLEKTFNFIKEVGTPMYLGGEEKSLRYRR
ncbi:MAG TPA: NAD-dependent epimerase/dehydratase family protein [Candidatus Desulfofervidus auxilii]|uniref:NAD-dependent epimerase/dehydratase family protein n=1 Tax=Desulfofervidus auxilii TaxID=1621989 RepID=A0A7C0Y8K8_DESA2|nr:NAD-dependent epimerase/dehydratase family protein [Candidatus Desulfofervidus auxilii]